MFDSVTVESYDALYVTYTAPESITLESDVFGKVKAIGTAVSNFFSNLFDKIKEFLNLRGQLEKLFHSGIANDIKDAVKDDSVYKIDYSKVEEIQVPIPLGFSTDIVSIAQYLRDNTDIVSDYNKFMDEFDKRISRYITNDKERIRFTPVDTKKVDKVISKIDNDINKLLNTKSRDGSATVDKLVGSKSGLKDAIANMSIVFKINDEFTFKNAMSKIDDVVPKIDALQELIEDEKIEVSKESLKDIIADIESAANYTTMIGKLGLVQYETTRLAIRLHRAFKVMLDDKLKADYKWY